MDLYQVRLKMRIYERIFGKILFAFGHELFNFKERVNNVINESIPGLARELLPEWEEDLGLPDECSLEISTQEERARIAHAKYTTKYRGMSKQFFIDYVLSIGSVVKVYDLIGTGKHFSVNKNRVDRTPEDGIDGARLWSSVVTFKWVVAIQKDDTNKDYLHCRFLQMNPAHMVLIWVEVDEI